MSGQKRILVTGAGGFIGHHLVSYLVERDYWVRGVDIKEPEFEPTRAHEFEVADLRRWENCLRVTREVDEVYHLAANMGGIGFISQVKAAVVHDNSLMNIHMLEAARERGVERFLFTSSACIYPGYRQETTDITPLREEDAYPADPEDGYGWEKLFMERQCRHYREEYGLKTFAVRFHNIFGPLGTYDGGREKSPAAICRKVALTDDGGEIEVWGDGLQTRSYCYISDCVEGLFRLMQSNFNDPINLGQDRLITVDELVDLVCVIAGKKLIKRHDLSKPQGVRGRNADIGLIMRVLGWKPGVSLEEGLAITYGWICHELAREGRLLKRRHAPRFGVEPQPVGPLGTF